MNTEYPVELYDTDLFDSPMPLTNSFKAPAKVFVVRYAGRLIIQ